MDDDSAQREQAKRLFWRLHFAMQVVLTVIGLLAHVVIYHLWHGPDFGRAVTLLPLAASWAAATWIFRRRGLSRETRFEMLWPNARTPEDGPAAPFTLRFPNSWRWCWLGGCSLIVALIGLVCVGTPIGRWGPSAPVDAVAATVVGLGAFALFSRPVMRLDAWGIREVSGRQATWQSIRYCHVVIKRNVFGDVFWVSVHALGDGERRLATAILLNFNRAQQHDFLLALHQALLPHEDAPDIAQVLGEGE